MGRTIVFGVAIMLVCVATLSPVSAEDADAASAETVTETGRRIAFIPIAKAPSKPKQVQKFLKKAGYEVHLLVGKSDIYSAVENAVVEHKVVDNDSVIICHDDIYVNDEPEDFNFWLDGVLHLNRTGFVGVIGSTETPADGRSTYFENKWMYVERFYTLRGLISSEVPVKHPRWTMLWGPPGKVTMLDGMFLACKGHVLKKINLGKPKSFPGKWVYQGEYYSGQAHLLGLYNYAAPLLISHKSIGPMVLGDSGRMTEDEAVSAKYSKNHKAYVKSIKKKMPLKARMVVDYKKEKTVTRGSDWQGRRLAFIVSRTKKTAKTTGKNIEAYLRSAGYTVRFLTNQASLLGAYGDATKKWVQDDDQVIFCHDDIEIMNPVEDFRMWMDISLADPNTGWVGVAGSNVLQKHTAWFETLIHPEIVEHRQKKEEFGFGHHLGFRGVVFHKEYSLKKYSFYGGYGRSMIMDGVFLATTGKLVKELDLVKPDFLPSGFHYYDVWATFLTHMNNKNNRVIPLHIVHASEGNFGTEAFAKSNEAFRAKFMDQLPKATRGLEKYIDAIFKNNKRMLGSSFKDEL